MDLLQHGHIYKSWVNTKLYLQDLVTGSKYKIEAVLARSLRVENLASYRVWEPPGPLNRAPKELGSPLTGPPRAAGPRVLSIT